MVHCATDCNKICPMIEKIPRHAFCFSETLKHIGYIGRLLLQVYKVYAKVFQICFETLKHIDYIVKLLKKLIILKLKKLQKINFMCA